MGRYRTRRAVNTVGYTTLTVVAAASGAVVPAGIYGVVVGRRQLDDPRRWYRDETLRSLVDGWNAGEDPRWILDSLTVSVVPGGVLVSGAF